VTLERGDEGPAHETGLMFPVGRNNRCRHIHKILDLMEADQICEEQHIVSLMRKLQSLSTEKIERLQE